MAKKLYKYMGADIMNKVFSEPGKCSFKCSYPKDFNDPYELFLTIDYEQDPHMLAFYHDTVGNIPQAATTCFSKSPTVIPMWAHYGHNHHGVVLEIDEEKILQHLPEISFGDVDYQDEPHEQILEQLYRAHGTKKPRHTYFLRQAVFSGAYYTKRACWSYEQERRLVANSEDVNEVNGLLLLTLPYDCVTAVITGHNATGATVDSAKQLSDNLGSPFYQLKIGKCRADPFFFDKQGKTHIFHDEAIVPSRKNCEECREPVAKEIKRCSWCAIEDQHRKYAAESNPFRAIDNAGFLQDYFEGMRRIDRGEQ